MGTSVDKDRLIFFFAKGRKIMRKGWLWSDGESKRKKRKKWMFVVYVQKGKILLKRNFLEYKFDNSNIWGGGKIGRSREKEDRDRLGEKEDSWKRRVHWEKEKLWSSVENPWKKREDIEEKRICWREHLYNF